MRLILLLITTISLSLKSQNCNTEKRIILTDSLRLKIGYNVKTLLKGNWKLFKVTDDKNIDKTIINEKFSHEGDFIFNDYGANQEYEITENGYKSIMTFPGNDEAKVVNHFKFIFLKKSNQLKYIPKEQDDDCWIDGNIFPVLYVDKTILKTYYIAHENKENIKYLIFEFKKVN